MPLHPKHRQYMRKGRRKRSCWVGAGEWETVQFHQRSREGKLPQELYLLGLSLIGWVVALLVALRTDGPAGQGEKVAPGSTRCKPV